MIFKDLAAAEPHASPARLAELRTLAKAQTRHAVPFWDVTVSVSKSITLFYGGLLAAAEQARRSGDAAQADYLDRRAGRVWAAIMEGNRAALEYLQDEAGMTRTGYHRGSGTESGAELGKWEHARNWVIGSFRQHTSRDGDPQLHVHNLVLNKVETERDGKWRKLDSRSLYRFQGAAAAIAAVVMETALTREFGVAWVPRADGHGREIAGISQELMDAFSSRRQAITADARAVAAEREAQTGRRPDARQMYRIQKDIAYRTRAAKPETPLDIRAKLREWEQTAREQDLGELSAIPAAVAEAARVARERERQSGQDAAAPEVLRVARADRVGVRPSAWPRPGRGRVPAHRAIRPLRHPQRRPIPGRWTRSCSCAGGRRKSALTPRRSTRSGGRSPGRRPAPARRPARRGSGRWRTRRPPAG